MNTNIFLVTLLCVTLFTVLLIGKYIGPAYYTSLVFLSAIVALALFGFDRLKELDLKNLKMTLSEINETKRDIYANAKSVKEMGENIAELVAYNLAWSNRFVGDDHIDNLVSSRMKVLSVLEELHSDQIRKNEILEQIDSFIIHDLVDETVRAAKECAKPKFTIDMETSFRQKLEQQIDKLSINDLNELLTKLGAKCEKSERSAVRLHEYVSTRTLPK